MPCKIPHTMLYEHFIFTAVDQKCKLILMENCRGGMYSDT